MNALVLCATPRVGATILLDCLRGALPDASEYPDGEGAMLVHTNQLPGIELPSTPICIYMQREDRLAQAVSWAYSAQLGRWNSSQKSSGRATYKRDDITVALEAIERHDREWKEWFGDSGQPVVVLTYEEWSDDPAGKADELLRTWEISGAARQSELKPFGETTKKKWQEMYESGE
jgi:LPS sulfotransferase NodH